MVDGAAVGRMRAMRWRKQLLNSELLLRVRCSKKRAVITLKFRCSLV